MLLFTVTSRDRRSDLMGARVDALRAAVRATMMARPIHVDAWVVLPEHMHCVWTLPVGDAGSPERWQMIKAGFSRAVPERGGRAASLVRKQEAGFWQRRYWEHAIRGEGDYAAHVDYVHFYPVKHGLVGDAGPWPYTSFGQCVRRGDVSSGLSGGGVEVGDVGER